MVELVVNREECLFLFTFSGILGRCPTSVAGRTISIDPPHLNVVLMRRSAAVFCLSSDILAKDQSLHCNVLVISVASLFLFHLASLSDCVHMLCPLGCSVEEGSVKETLSSHREAGFHCFSDGTTLTGVLQAYQSGSVCSSQKNSSEKSFLLALWESKKSKKQGKGKIEGGSSCP